MGKKVFLSLLCCWVCVSFSACKPHYPKCDQDEHCLEKGEVCINGQCQECRDAQQCDVKYPNEKRECRDGRCEMRAECTTDIDCTATGPGLVCRGGKCLPECAQDGDCGAGHKCISQKCTAECKEDMECGPNRFCVSGECRDTRGGGGAAGDLSSQCRPSDPSSGDVVALDKVHFEFNKYDLTDEAKQALNKVIECVKQAPQGFTFVVEGHCDDRGTQEYNLALGEKRAQAVQAYLKTQGVAQKQMTLRSKGENEPLCTTNDEACFTQNRRVQFVQKP